MVDKGEGESMRLREREKGKGGGRPEQSYVTHLSFALVNYNTIILHCPAQSYL